MRPLLLTIFILFFFSACQKDKDAEALQLYRQGMKMEQLNHPDSATQNYRKAAELLKGSEHYELLSQIYNQYGELLLDKEMYGKSSDAHWEALKHASLLKEKSQTSRAYRGIGKNYFLQKKSSEALHYFNKAFELINQINDPEEKSSIYNNLSNIYYILKEYGKALEFNARAITLTRDSLKIYRNYSVKGKILILTHHYDSAYLYLLAASRCKDIRIQTSCLFKLSEMPAESGITDSMKYTYLNSAQILQDSIDMMSNTVKISEAEYQHQLLMLKKEDKHKLVCTIVLTSFLLAGVSLYIFVRYKRRISKYKEKISQLCDESGRKEGQVSENNDREKQIIHIISRTGNACCSRFTSSEYYRELRRKLNEDNYSLTYAELDELQQIILKEFDVYIQQITGIINLSTNDSVLCSLSLLRLATKECAACRGVSCETIRSQKARIKKRIPKTLFNNGLFHVIFGEE